MLTAQIPPFGLNPTRPNYLPWLIRRAIHNELKELDTVPEVIELSPILFLNMEKLFDGDSHGTMVRSNELDGQTIRFSERTQTRKAI